MINHGSKPIIAEPAPIVASIEGEFEDDVESQIADKGQPIPIDSTSISTPEISSEKTIMDMITARIYEPLDERRFMDRSHDLYSRFERRKRTGTNNERPVLPIFTKKQVWKTYFSLLVIDFPF